MALDPNIALGVRPLEVPNQLAQYGQLAQIQNAQRQGEVAQMQLEQLKQDRVEMQAFQKHLVDNGGNPDLKQFATMLLKSPKHYEKGVEMMQKLQEQEKFETMGRKLYPELFGAAPAGAGPMGAPPVAGAMPMAAPTARPSGALGSGTFGMMPEPVNNLAPPSAAPAAPSNALIAPVGKTPDQLRKEIMLFGGSNAPGAKNMVDMLKTQLTESLKQTDTQREMQSLGLPLTPEGFKQYIALKQAPPTQTDLRKNFEYAKTPEGGNYKGSFADFKAISTPKTSVTVSTEKKYGEQFAGKIADSDSNKLGAAEKAPQLAESANRIINLVSQGNLFTGPIADVKLNIARALNVVGASNDEKIANTEALIAATGQSTLDAIKGAGLGTGQGFTDKDLKFLQGIAGGAITYTPQTLTELATLQHRVATRSVENWNRRFKEIPKSATEGLGIQAVPNVPPLSSGAKAAAARPAGVGVDWTFERDAAGNRAWVSPDRKSFKEAQ
jgi:hypothetical protein